MTYNFPKRILFSYYYVTLDVPIGEDEVAIRFGPKIYTIVKRYKNHFILKEVQNEFRGKS